MSFLDSGVAFFQRKCVRPENPPNGTTSRPCDNISPTVCPSGSCATGADHAVMVSPKDVVMGEHLLWELLDGGRLWQGVIRADGYANRETERRRRIGDRRPLKSANE